MINHVNKDAKLHQVHQVTQKSCLFFTVGCSVLELQHFSLAPQTGRVHPFQRHFYSLLFPHPQEDKTKK